MSKTTMLDIVVIAEVVDLPCAFRFDGNFRYAPYPKERVAC